MILSASLGERIEGVNLIKSGTAFTNTQNYVFWIGMHGSCIVEVWGGYAYGDASINSYYKYGIHFRTNGVADFYEIHKSTNSRLKLGYRWYGVDSGRLGIILNVIQASSFVIKISGAVERDYIDLASETPGDATWL